MEKIATAAVILAFFLLNFLYIDYNTQCFIWLEPNIALQNWNLREIIEIVKANDRQSYDLMCQKTNYISASVPIGCPYFDGGCFDPSKPKAIYISNDVGNPSWASAILVHEICHLDQHTKKVDFNEVECYQKDSSFLKQIQLFTSL